MVASSHGREGGQVMADLLTRLDVIPRDVRPEHKEVYFTIYPFISLHWDQQIHPGLQVTLCYVLTWLMPCLTSEQIVEAAFTGRKITPSDVNANQQQHLELLHPWQDPEHRGKEANGRSTRESRRTALANAYSRPLLEEFLPAFPELSSTRALMCSTHTSQWRYSESATLKCPSANAHNRERRLSDNLVFALTPK